MVRIALGSNGRNQTDGRERQKAAAKPAGGRRRHNGSERGDKRQVGMVAKILLRTLPLSACLSRRLRAPANALITGRLSKTRSAAAPGISRCASHSCARCSDDVWRCCSIVPWQT